MHARRGVQVEARESAAPDSPSPPFDSAAGAPLGEDSLAKKFLDATRLDGDESDGLGGPGTVDLTASQVLKIEYDKFMAATMRESVSLGALSRSSAKAAPAPSAGAHRSLGAVSGGV